jgi:hypothetical protein
MYHLATLVQNPFFNRKKHSDNRTGQKWMSHGFSSAKMCATQIPAMSTKGVSDQGDPIGRIFAIGQYVLNFGQFVLNFGQFVFNFGQLVSLINLTNVGIGCSYGEFFEALFQFLAKNIYVVTLAWTGTQWKPHPNLQSSKSTPIPVFLHMVLHRPRVARLFLVEHTKTGKNLPNYNKIYQMAVFKVDQMSVN